MNHQINTDLRFSIIPEWVLDADISDRAIRLYSILARYADNETLQAFPSRETLAKRANCHWRSVDRAIDELVTLGAITKQHRRNGESYQSNMYTLRRVGPQVSPPTDRADRGVLTPQSVPTDTGGNLTITTELEPLNDTNRHFTDSDMSIHFNDFWEIYPRKMGKGEAKAAFVKAVNRFGHEVILDGVRALAADPNLPAPQFVPRAATWLNQERWDDEPYPVPDPASIPGVQRGPKSPHVGGPREWVKDMHDMDEHWECRPGEFGCK
jgi:hypothetical protein